MESPLKRVRFNNNKSSFYKNTEVLEYKYEQVSPDSLKRKRVLVEIDNDVDMEWKDNDDDIMKLVNELTKWNMKD